MRKIQVAEAQEACREALLATAFVFGADKKRYGELHTQLINNHILNKTGYPKTLTKAFDILNKWKTPTGDRRLANQAKQKDVSEVSLHKALFFDAAGPFHKTDSGLIYLFCYVHKHS